MSDWQGFRFRSAALGQRVRTSSPRFGSSPFRGGEDLCSS